MIDIIELNKILIELKKVINDYNSIYLNYYHNLESLTNYWNSKKCITFLDVVSKEKIIFQKNIYKLYDLYDILEYINEKYKKIGNKIELNTDNYDSYIIKKENLINKLTEIISLLDSINILQLDNYKINKILDEKNKLIKIKEEIENSNEKTKNITNNINDIEFEVNSKLSNLKINIVPETDIREYTTYKEVSLDEIYVDLNSIELVMNKTNFYITNEESCTKKILILLSEIQNQYKTNNSDKLSKIMEEITKNIHRIILMNKTNYKILRDNVQTIKETNIKISNITSEIGKISNE